MKHEGSYDFETEVTLYNVDVPVSLYKEDVEEAAKYFDMIVFEDEDEIYTYLLDNNLLESAMQRAIENAVKSPYYREKFLSMIKDSGLFQTQ